MTKDKWPLKFVERWKRCSQICVGVVDDFMTAIFPKSILVMTEQTANAVSYRPHFSLQSGFSWTYKFLEQRAPDSELRLIERTLVWKMEPGAILNYVIDLPLAVLPGLRSAAELGLSTWTPFDSNDVYFAAVPIHRSSEKAAIEIRLVPKSTVVMAGDLDPDIVLLGEEPLWEVPLDTPKLALLAKQRRVHVALAISAIVLATLCVSAAQWNLDKFVQHLKVREQRQLELIKAEREAASRLAKLRQERSAAEDSASRGNWMSDALNVVARVLPPRGFLIEVRAMPKQISGSYSIANTDHRPSELLSLLTLRSIRPISSTASLVEFEVAR